jgi:hypothetical protein
VGCLRPDLLAVAEAGGHDDDQIGLKCSKGSRQVRQRYIALQAVDPKADKRSV